MQSVQDALLQLHVLEYHTIQLSALHGRALMPGCPWDTNPLYALLHEACYCNGGPSNWAAQRVRDTHYSEHFDAALAAANGRPVMFTGEPQMMCKLAWQVCRSQPLRGRIMAWDQECVRADLVLSCVF